LGRKNTFFEDASNLRLSIFSAWQQGIESTRSEDLFALGITTEPDPHKTRHIRHKVPGSYGKPVKRLKEPKLDLDWVKTWIFGCTSNCTHFKPVKHLKELDWGQGNF